jgi:tetratricopeptide (TPR) repeat protein
MAFGKALLGTIICCTLGLPSAVAQTQVPTAAYERATRAIRGEDFPQAEQLLRQILRDHPSEARALSLLGVVLDALKRYPEAEGFYKRAIAINPRSVSALNNLGNHYLVRGDFAKARATYLRVVAIDPRHPNANHQLAQLSVAANQGTTALKFLDRLPMEEQSAPAIQMLRAQALRSAGRQKEGADLLGRIETQAGDNARVANSLGMIYAEWKRYEDAERAFSKALQASPANFDILYNLGLAALRAKHFDRAQEILAIALQQRADDVDLLQNLARVYAEIGRLDQAIVLLVRAEKLAPTRADIQMFLAHMAEESGFFGDAAIAYDKYYKLRPHEDTIRRERGFALARSAKIKEGLIDLRWYVEKHPEDGRGWYELGVAETVQERDKALEFLSKAVVLDPKLHAARFARAVLLTRAGRPAEAIEDLKIVLADSPKDFHALDALGQAQLQLNRVEEAVESLRQAVELSPKEPKFLTHYGRALQRAGRREEAQAIFNRFRLLGPSDYGRRAKAGLFEYLRLPPSEQQAQYVKNLRAGSAGKPNDPTLQLRLGKALLMENKTEEALEAYRKVLSLTEDPAIYTECATDLLGAAQYGLAKEFLTRLVTAQPDSTDVQLDLAIAVYHADGAMAGLKEIDKIPPDKRDGDYFLLCAQILDSLEKPREAEASLNQALAREPTRPDLYFNAALFLIKHREYGEASKLLEHALRTIPDSPELMLVQAMNLEFLQLREESQAVLEKIQSRWPEWYLPYLVNGIMLEIRFRSAQAKSLLETAVALGAHDAVVYYYLASAITHATPEDTESAQQAIEQALQLNPEDAYVRSLAGKIAYTRKDYPAALEHLTAALRLWPEMIEAHQTLAGVYKAMGDKEKSIAELKEIVRIKQANPTADQAPPFPVGDLLFTVRPLARPPS